MKKSTGSIELGTANIRKLLITYSVPAIISQMAASLYNIVDSVFIGHGVGALAITGLAITFPLMNLSAAFGALVGAGGSTLVSIKMGQKDKESAEHVLGNVVSLNLILGTILTILGLIYIDEILYFFGAGTDTIGYARDYMEIILYGNIITHLYLGLNNVMRSSGYPQKAMKMTLLTVVVNAVLDMLFIFYFGWGIKGAAIATIIAQLIALVFTINHFIQKTSFIHFKRGIWGFKRNIVGGILSIGMSPFVFNLCACLVVVIINRSMQKYGGDLAIGAYGIVNRIVMLFAMVVYGFNQGMQPIAGYNYGAKLYLRVNETLKQTIICATMVTTFAFIVGEFFPREIAMMFTTDQQLIDLAAQGMRIVVAVFPIVGFQMVTGNFFQSIGLPKKAILLSATRQLIFLIPMMLILPLKFGLIGVWLSMPAADFLSTFLAGMLLRGQYKKFKQKGLSETPIIEQLA